MFESVNRKSIFFIQGKVPSALPLKLSVFSSPQSLKILRCAAICLCLICAGAGAGAGVCICVCVCVCVCVCCCAVLCCACAVLCCAVLCCAVLCCATLSCDCFTSPCVVSRVMHVRVFRWPERTPYHANMFWRETLKRGLTFWSSPMYRCSVPKILIFVIDIKSFNHKHALQFLRISSSGCFMQH